MTIDKEAIVTYTDLAEAATKLPPEERRKLLEVIARSLGEGASRPGWSMDSARGRFDPSRSALDQLRGIARPAGPLPTDDEVREILTDELIEKYRRACSPGRRGELGGHGPRGMARGA